MADPGQRRPGNVPGRVYVDDSCIWCSACVVIAPEHFEEVDGDVVCVHQPRTAEQRAACEEAAVSCPVDAIGLDDHESDIHARLSTIRP